MRKLPVTWLRLGGGRLTSRCSRRGRQDGFPRHEAFAAGPAAELHRSAGSRGDLMGAKRILVLGSGFAGLWSALGAARKLGQLGYGPDEVAVTLVNRDGFHNIRVRNYEADLTAVRVPLEGVLEPVGVRRVEGEVTGIDLAGQAVAVTSASGPLTLPYDRLVFALGSQLIRPDVAG